MQWPVCWTVRSSKAVRKNKQKRACAKFESCMCTHSWFWWWGVRSYVRCGCNVLAKFKHWIESNRVTPRAIPKAVFKVLRNTYPGKTWCQILCSIRLKCVSKILTPCRMLKKCLLIAKINRWNNSFQNMYDMLQAKWTVWPGKLILPQKTPKNA